MARHIKNYRYTILVLAVGMVFGWLVATNYHLVSVSAGPPPQGASQLHGSQAPTDPPGLAEKKQRDKQVGNPSPGRPTKQQLLAIIAKNKGGAERAKQAKAGSKGKALQGAAQQADPPGLAEKKQRDKQVGNPTPGRPTREQLLQRIAPAAIEKAKQGKPQASNRSFGELLASLNPLRPVKVHAQSTSVANFNSALYTGSPYARGSMWGTVVDMYTRNRNYQSTYEYTMKLSDGTSTRLFARFDTYAPSSGWYIVSANAWAYDAVKISRWSGSGFVVLDTVARQSGWANYPTLQYITEGYHYFYFSTTAYGGKWLYINRMSLTPF